VEAFRPYPRAAAQTIRDHGGEFLAADLESDVLEGTAPPVSVIIRFVDKAAALAWYESAEYQAVAPLRRNNTVGSVVLLDDDMEAARRL
jgi:uncharacterized protein (DUF1330 family)